MKVGRLFEKKSYVDTDARSRTPFFTDNDRDVMTVTLYRRMNG
ncbi:hypothetical protein ACU8KH_05768 [Lachancea thermotolerans]